MKRMLPAFALLCVSIIAGFLVPTTVVKAEAPAIAAKQEQKRLAVFLDGTWNKVESNTNVWRMKMLCAPKGADGKTQLVFYGVGVNGVFGGGWGKGLDDNIKEAYEWLVENYSDGDEIFIFGFSRGAYMARSLAGLVTKLGILKPGSPIGVGQLYERYKRQEEQTIWKLFEQRDAGQLGDLTLEERWMLKYSQRAKVKVVGVWDTGRQPRNSRPRHPRRQHFHAGLPSHGAADSHRERLSRPCHRRASRKVRPDLLGCAAAEGPEGRGRGPEAARQRRAALVRRRARQRRRRICERPARPGPPAMDHEEGLAARTGVPQRCRPRGDVLGATINDSYKEFLKGVYAKVSRRYYRPIGQDPEVRDDGAHANVNETIDQSVFERWRKVPDYRPPSIKVWADRKKVDPAKLTTSVVADDPAISAPD